MKIFVSSTIDDLKDLRNELYRYLKSSHSPLFSEMPDFPANKHPDSMTNCLKVVEECDLFVMLLDKRSGLLYSERANSPYPEFFNMTITEAEYRCARKKGKPVCIFVRKNVDSDCKIYRQMKDTGEKKIMKWYSDHSIYEFYDQLMHEKPTPWRYTFDSISEITDTLKIAIQEVHDLTSCSSPYKLDKIKSPRLRGTQTIERTKLNPTLLKVPSYWNIVSTNGDIATVSNGNIQGITPIRNYDLSYLCFQCSNYGPWNGNRCLSCGNTQHPSS